MFHDQKLYDELVEIMPEILGMIKKAVEANPKSDKIKEYPKLSYSSYTVFPQVDLYPSKINITRLFRFSPDDEDGPAVDLAALPAYVNILERFMAIPAVKAYLGVYSDEYPEQAEEMFHFNCEYLIISLIERYYYLYNSEFDETLFSDIFRQVDNYIYADKLAFDISVPILFVRFESDYFELTPDISIRRIDDDVHIARHNIKAFSPAINDVVLMSATHELVLKNRFCKRSEVSFDTQFSKIDFYPVKIIETFFTVLNVATGITSGYAQLIIHPQQWTSRYRYDLTSISGLCAPNYPAYFDDYYWNKIPHPFVADKDADSLRTLFNGVIQSKENKLDFALKRFYKSIMRQEEEDIIIDIIIAIEILLGDREKNEITHKLALRIATLLSRFSPEKYSAQQVFSNVKKIYAYRSAIIHGSHSLEASREIRIGADISIPVVDLAGEYLRELLRSIITDRTYLDPVNIDLLLLK